MQIYGHHLESIPRRRLESSGRWRAVSPARSRSGSCRLRTHEQRCTTISIEFSVADCNYGQHVDAVDDYAYSIGRVRILYGDSGLRTSSTLRPCGPRLCQSATTARRGRVATSLLQPLQGRRSTPTGLSRPSMWRRNPRESSSHHTCCGRSGGLLTTGYAVSKDRIGLLWQG